MQNLRYCVLRGKFSKGEIAI